MSQQYAISDLNDVIIVSQGPSYRQCLAETLDKLAFFKRSYSLEQATELVNIALDQEGETPISAHRLDNYISWWETSMKQSLSPEGNPRKPKRAPMTREGALWRDENGQTHAKGLVINHGGSLAKQNPIRRVLIKNLDLPMYVSAPCEDHVFDTHKDALDVLADLNDAERARKESYDR